MRFRSCAALRLSHGELTFRLMLVSLHLTIATLYLSHRVVIIKGTQIYDSSKGSFVDLSVLDVLQIFGRAGRPGMESSGIGFICTMDDRLTHYLDAVTSQVRSSNT